MSKIFIIPTAALFLLSCTHSQSSTKHAHGPESGIETKEVIYTAGDKQMIGYLAKPKNPTTDVPGILVVHEWWGQTDYPRKRAEQLARLGYAAFAVDMYGSRKVAEHPKNAGAFAGSVMENAEKVSKPFLAALKQLKSTEGVDESKLAAIGYCFGGSVVLEMARQKVGLAGVVSFHGGLMTPSKAKPGDDIPSILVLNGGSDPMVKADDIAAFTREMDQAKVDYQIVSYPEARHGFTNPAADENGRLYELPLAYNAKADQDSWQKMQGFFAELFNQ